MANTLYDYCRQRFLEAQINWMTDTVKVILVSTSAYTPQTAVHQYLADYPRVGPHRWPRDPDGEGYDGWRSG